MTADAMRRLRLRRAGLLPDLATCTACGRQARSTRTAPLCSRCWRLPFCIENVQIFPKDPEVITNGNDQTR
jgi:recombinational DNA repair protein (RecF pathway)